jgi:DNA-binding CsgD family transcriptional regulator
LKKFRVFKMTKRQQQVIALLEAGYTTRKIAERLNISERAVIYHITQLRRRLGASSRAQIMAMLILRRNKLKREDTD